MQVPEGRWARSWFWLGRVWDLFRGDSRTARTTTILAW
jgi:hypothetical protein